jgi:hypothetical protein
MLLSLFLLVFSLLLSIEFTFLYPYVLALNRVGDGQHGYSVAVDHRGSAAEERSKGEKFPTGLHQG